jgi:hypothetical protein
MLAGSGRSVSGMRPGGPDQLGSGELGPLSAGQFMNRALGLADDQTAVFEHAQVLGDRGSGDRQLLGQLPDRAWAPSEQVMGKRMAHFPGHRFPSGWPTRRRRANLP